MARRRVKYLDFKVPDSVWKGDQPFISLPTSTKDKNARALMRWSPGLYKAEWRVRLINSHTGGRQSHLLVEVVHRYDWIIAIWNPSEALDAILGVLPAIFATSVLIGAVGSLAKKKEDGKEVLVT